MVYDLNIVLNYTYYTFHYRKLHTRSLEGYLKKNLVYTQDSGIIDAFKNQESNL